MTEKKLFGKTSDGTDVYNYVMTSESGMTAEISEFGATIVKLTAKNRDGVYEDVVLGYDTLPEYERGTAHFGGTIGRYANRIRGGKFMLFGTPVVLYKNDGANTLHGGKEGFDKRVWKGDICGDNAVVFTYESKDGEENFPGNLSVSVKYSLINDTLTTEYCAVSDKDTIINLTNHSYFNLRGHDKNVADAQILRINSELFTGIDTELLPDGTILPVECTPLDFRNYARINSRIDFDYIQMRNAGGYDHNFVLKKRERNIMSLCAELYDDESGRFMTVHTTEPGVQLYSGNFLDCEQGKGGALYMRRGGICLETQHFPNSMEHTHFPSPILKAGEKFTSITRYSFSVKDLDPKMYS